jgi:hypothetical protein
MATVPRQIMEIGSGDNSIETTEAFNISGEFDIDNLWGTLSFSLPYLLPGQKNVTTTGVLDITRLKKFDTVKLYYDEIENTISPVRPGNLVNVFYGFIDSIKLVKSKDSIDYSISALGTLGLSNDKNLLFERKTGELQNLIIGSATSQGTLDPNDIGLLQLAFGAQTGDIVPEVAFIDIDANTLFVNLQGGKKLGDVLKEIRDKYAVIIHQTGNGTLQVFTPFFLLSSRGSQYLNAYGWQFELGVNAYNMDYGDLTNAINSVVVLGLGGVVGVAVDPIMVQLNAGSGNPITQANYNYLVFEQRDLQGVEECQKVARQKLLEITRNFTITFKTKYDPRFAVGQPFTINDNDRFNNDQVFIIKKFSFTINKDDISCDITGFANTLDQFPEDIVLDSTGIADVDQLEIRNKLPAEINWLNNI